MDSFNDESIWFMMVHMVLPVRCFISIKGTQVYMAPKICVRVTVSKGTQNSDFGDWRSPGFTLKTQIKSFPDTVSQSPRVGPAHFIAAETCTSLLTHIPKVLHLSYSR